MGHRCQVRHKAPFFDEVKAALAFVVSLLPPFTVNRPLRPDAGLAPTRPTTSRALPRISISHLAGNLNEVTRDEVTRFLG
jgi:hypothetical protein